MRKFLVALLFLSLSAFAQRRQDLKPSPYIGGNGHHGGVRGGVRGGARSGAIAPPVQGREPRVRVWDNHRDHWRAPRFERKYFRSHFGPSNVFNWRRSRWYGRPYFLGSRFYCSGFWFIVIDPVPVFWYEDAVFIDQFGDEYYLCDPNYPGTCLRVGVEF